MASQREVVNSAQLDQINATQVVQLYEEMRLLEDEELASERLREISEELHTIFEDNRQAEIAFIMIAKTYNL